MAKKGGKLVSVNGKKVTSSSGGKITFSDGSSVDAGSVFKGAGSSSSKSSSGSSGSSSSGSGGIISYDQYLDNKKKAESGLLTGDALSLASSQNAAYRAATGMQDASYYDTRYNSSPSKTLYPGDPGFGGYYIDGKQYTKTDFDRLHEAILKPNDSNRLFKAAHTNTDGSFNPYGGGGYELISNGAVMLKGENDYSQYGQPGTRMHDSFMMNLDPVNYKGGGVPFMPTSEYYQDPYNYAEMVNQGRISPQVAGVYDENINWLPIPQQIPQQYQQTYQPQQQHQQPQQLQANMLPSAMINFAIPDFEYDIPMPEEYTKGGTVFTPTLAMVDQWQRGKQQAHDEYRARYMDEWNRYMNMLDEAYRRDSMNLDEAYRRDNMNLGQQNLHYQSQGLTPGMSLNDPSAQIRQLQSIAHEASKVGDMDRFNWAHSEAEKLRIAAGWGSGGADGSLTQHLMTQAGQPSWDRTAYEQKYADDRADVEWEKNFKERSFSADEAYRYSALANKGSSGGGGGKTTKEIQEEGLQVLMAASTKYRTGTDYLADIERNKGQIIQLVGSAGFNKLVAEARKLDEQGYKGPNFTPGQGEGSPIKNILSMVSENFSQPTSANVPGNVSSWIDEAMKIAGVGEDWRPYMEWLAMKESSGNPNARNSTPVNNGKHGKEHATGLLQTLPSTFRANAASGMTDIYNPVHNAVASINYIKGRYGHPSKIKGMYSNNFIGY